MKHKLKLQDIESQTLTFCVASSGESGECKDLRIIMKGQDVKWVARHFIKGQLEAASLPLDNLKEAIAVYNQF